MRRIGWPRWAVAALLCSMSISAWALVIPKASPKDARIRSTQYDPNDVTAVSTMAGAVTHIVLADDEQYVTHAFGDAAAYAFAQVGRHIFIKPIAPQADTNLIIVTDKRDYTYLLQNSKARPGKETFRLGFTYPETEKSQMAAQSQKNQIDQALAQTDLAINWQGYSMSGDQALAPVHAWDDGAQTWLRFAPGQDLPAVYYVDPQGNEVIVNRHMQDAQTIVLHRIAAQWHLRLGDQVLAIYNERSDQVRSLPTGTISPDVERVLRKEPN